MTDVGMGEGERRRACHPGSLCTGATGGGFGGGTRERLQQRMREGVRVQGVRAGNATHNLKASVASCSVD